MMDADRFWDTCLGDVLLGGTNVLDPFVGGGASLLEAERCGARVIDYDIDPVATFITRFELEARQALDEVSSRCVHSS